MTRFRVFDLARLSAIAFALFAIATAVVPARADETPDKPAVAPPKRVAPPRFVPMKPSVAIKTLTAKGLKKLKPTSAGIFWVLPDETTVHEKLADFWKVAEANHVAAKNAKATAGETSKENDELEKARTRYSELKVYSEKPETIPRKITARFNSQQAMMQALQEDMNAQMETINKLQPKLQGKFISDMPPGLKAALVEWMTARGNLIVAYPAAKEAFSDLDKRYADLTADADVATALRSLSKRNHLGSPEFEQDRKAMAEAEAAATSDEVPFYREGALDSVAALLNDTLPIVIRIQSTQPNSPNWAPADLLAKAGITINPASPTVALTFTGNGKRVVQCRPIIVPKLRIGKIVLENLKFLAMPVDAKDLGLQISSNELKGYDQTPDRATWLYKIVKQDQPKTDEAAKPGDANSANPNEKTDGK